MDNPLEIIIAVLTILGAILGAGWKVNQAENFIRDEIGRIERDISRVEGRLNLHLENYSNWKEMSAEYRINDLYKRIDHKFNRLYSTQQNIQQYLSAKMNFVPRENHRESDSES